MWGFILRIFTAVVLTGISAWLSYRKPEQPTPGTQDDLGNPRADEGTEIAKIFGTVNIADPQVVQFGDFRTAPIIKVQGRRYGLFGPKNRTTIGFNYFLGVHFVMSLGPVDSINRIRVDKRVFWEGSLASGRISQSMPNLFGSSEREGGISGEIDFLPGTAAQGVNDYLAAITSGPCPAYRGVSSLVLRQVYIGNAPSLRPWDMRLVRIFSVDPGYNGGAQWYAEKAAIEREGGAAANYLMSIAGGALPPGLRNVADVIANDLGYVVNASPGETMRIFPTSPPPDGFGTSFNIASNPFGFASGWSWPLVLVYDDIATNLHFWTPSGGFGFTTAEAALDSAEAAPPYEISGYSKYRMWVNLGGNLSELPPEAGGVTANITVSATVADMNPAHILREILLSPDSGGTGNEADAGDTWEAAADTLFEEGFGLSIAWRGGADRVDFKKEIERHIDARSYIDRRTGLWEIKLIRDDYDEETLPVFDKTNVVSWANINFPQPSSLLNQLVVTWNDPVKEEPTSLTISNPARIRMAGSQIFQEKVSYPGIQRADLAGRVAMRDLQARSAPLVTGEFVTKNLPFDLNIGSPIKINEPRLGLVDKVVRITEIEDGNIREHGVLVKFVEDRFSLADESTLVIEPPIVEVIDPEPVTIRQVEEAPYALTVDRLGQPNVDEVLATDADAGFLFVAGAQPTPTSTESLVQRDSGGGYEELEPLAFVPGARTLGAMSNRADHTKVVVESRDALASVAVGSVAWLGGEYVVIDAVEAGDTSDPGDYWEPTEALTALHSAFTLTVKRGAWDTVPAAKAAGVAVVFYGDLGALEDDIQTAADSIDVKLQTVTTRGVLAIGDAPADTVVFNSRPIRPYPPGNLQVDGDYQTSPPSSVDGYALTWEHRDRLDLPALGHIQDGPALPEVGTTYLVRVEALDGDLDVLSTLTSENVGDDLTYTWVPVAAPAGTFAARFSVASVRDGYESWTRPSIITLLSAGERASEDSADVRAAEDGTDNIREIEG
jgi:hypothetical protein